MRRLATGGTSDVLLAKAEGPQGFERLVVLKVLLSKFERDSDLKAMFAREAAAYARLSHPSIVRLYDFFGNGDQLVMVLEYIDGPPLNRLRGMLKTIGQQLDDATALHVAACIFEALVAAHGTVDETGAAAPVIHRDVNPSNVLVTWDGHVKLADFGIAKVTGLSHESSAGLIKGTYGYMAPEQVKGEAVTPRADVYAAAIILWELLTKRRAFIRGALPEIEVLRELAEPRIVSIDVLRPDLDKNVREAIKRALLPQADKRTVTAEEMVSTLRAVAPEGEGRDRLAKALALVRHEPKSSPTSMPPPMPDVSDELQTGKVFPAGVVPPRPPAQPKVPRRTAPYGSVQASNALPRTPVLGPPRPRSFEKEMPAATLSPDEVATLMKKGTAASPAPPAAPEEVGPASAPGLASILEPSSPDVASPAPRPDVPRESRAVLALGDAIDEILRDVPSQVPPDIFPKTDPPADVARNAAEARKNAQANQDRPTLELGQTLQLGKLPPAPPMLEPLRRDLNATLVTPTGPKGMPSSFPQMNRTLAMHERVDIMSTAPTEIMTAEKATERPPPQQNLATTAPMPAVPPPSLSPSTAKMRAFTLPQEALGSVPPPAPTGSSPPQTLPLGAVHTQLPVVTAPPVPSPQPASPPTSGSGASPAPTSQPSSSRSSVVTVPPNREGGYRPAREPIPYPSSPPAKRRSPVFAILAVLLAVVAVGALGAVGYPRWRRSRAAVAPPPSAAYVAEPPSLPAPASALPPSSPVATGSAETVPPAMGRLKTTGTAPGRRIFVDERTVGQTPDAVLVKCGSRKVKLGSAGSTQVIDVPCGGEIAVGDK